MDVRALRYRVSFRNGSDQLEGDLVLPSGGGPHPVAVLVGGTGGMRDRGRWIEDLALLGLATLTWDSPGWGDSLGMRRWQAPDERTLEVTAAVQFLATVPEISPHGIGVIGADAGAWAAVLAAALTPQIRAAVLLSPPCTDPHGQELVRLGQRLAGQGFTGAEVGLAQLVLRERLRRLAAGWDAVSILQAEAPCRPTEWYGWLPGTTVPQLQAFASLAEYEPASLLASLACPVLAVFGADDPATSAWANAQALREALTHAPGDDHHLMILPRTDRAYLPAGAPGWTGPRPPGDWQLDVVGCIGDWLAPRLARYRWAAPRPGVPVTPGGGVALIPVPRAG